MKTKTKRIADDEVREERLEVRLTKDEKERLENEARSLSLSISAYTRMKLLYGDGTRKGTK